MFCHQCRTTLPNNAKFCLQCGASTSDDERTHTSPRFTNPLMPPPQVKKRTGLDTVINTIATISGVLFVGAILLIVVGFIALMIQSRLQQSQNSQRTEYQQIPLPQPRRIDLVDKTFHIEPGAYSWFAFDASSNSTVIGEFEAQGGKNDIHVLILDEIGFTNFKNGNAARTYYNSVNYITTDKFQLQLAPGNYYYVFSNKKSWFTSKTVRAKLVAEY